MTAPADNDWFVEARWPGPDPLHVTPATHPWCAIDWVFEPGAVVHCETLEVSSGLSAWTLRGDMRKAGFVDVRVGRRTEDGETFLSDPSDEAAATLDAALEAVTDLVAGGSDE